MPDISQRRIPNQREDAASSQKFVHPGIPGGGEQKILPGLKPGDWLCPACGEQLNFSLLVYMDP